MRRGENDIADYRKPYCTLFSAITDVLRQMALGDYHMVRKTLVGAQEAGEELVISRPDEEDEVK